MQRSFITVKQLVTLALLLPTPAAYGQHVQKAVIYFGHAKATLSVSDQKMLRTLLTKAGAYKVDVNRLGADGLGTENIDEITISGHTDADGSSSYNQQLSQARAESIYRYFTSIFNDTTKLSTFYYGEDKPIAPNGTAFDKRHNRRVEVVIKYTNSRVSTSTLQHSLPKKRDQSYLVNKEFVQTFNVSPKRKTVIISEEGNCS